MNKNAANLLGQKFHNLTVTKFLGLNKKSARIWECECDCGNQVTDLTTNALRTGKIKSCGCLRSEAAKRRRTGTKNIPGAYFCSLRNSARKRDLELSVDIEYLQNLLEEQDFKCALSGRALVMNVENTYFLRKGEKPLNTGSVDRIDSSLGYVEGNVQWIHKDLQSPKSSLTNQEFYELCKLVVENYEGMV